MKKETTKLLAMKKYKREVWEVFLREVPGFMIYQ